MIYFQEKSNRYYNLKEYTCQWCGNIFYKSRQKFCSKECSKQYLNQDEFKSKFSKTVSDARKKFLKENPDKHPWKKNTKFISKPCEQLKDFLKKNGYIFAEEYSPFLEKNFSVDIAFPDLKLGLEVNGNQHYNSDGQLRKYYQDRHDYFVANGWQLIELHYTLSYNHELVLDILTTNNIQKLNDYTKSYFDKKSVIIKRKQKRKQNNVKCNIRQKQPQLKIVSINYEVLLQRVDLLKNSGIDFSQFGWVSKAQKLLNLSHTSTRKFINKCSELFDFDFYKRKPYK